MYSPEVKCRTALICCTQTSTLQPIFSSDDYVFSCKFCPILQQHLSFRQKGSIAFYHQACYFYSCFHVTSNWHRSLSGQQLPYVSVSLHVYTCTTFYRECFESPRIPFHSRHSRLIEHFGSFWCTFQLWMPRPWCTFKKIQEGAETPWRDDDGEPCWIFVNWEREICLKNNRQMLNGVFLNPPYMV